MKYCRSILPGLFVITITAYSQPVPFARPTTDVPLAISDGQTTLPVYFGILPEGDFCIVPQDSINGHSELFIPPSPPGWFDTRMLWPRSGSNDACFGSGSPADYRRFTSYLQRDTFRVGISFPAQTPVTLSWPADLASYFRKLILTDVATGGAALTVDMLTATSASLGSDPFGIRIVGAAPRRPGDSIEIQIQVSAGWNLISIPVRSVFPSDSVRSIFPISLNPYVFEFTGGYVQRYRTTHGRGYWCRFPVAHTVTIRGIGYNVDTTSVSAGWNLIGTPFYPVSVDSIRTIPPGIIVSDFFGFSGGYTIGRTLLPGKGYMVKCSTPGRVVFPADF